MSKADSDQLEDEITEAVLAVSSSHLHANVWHIPKTSWERFILCRTAYQGAKRASLLHQHVAF